MTTINSSSSSISYPIFPYKTPPHLVSNIFLSRNRFQNKNNSMLPISFSHSIFLNKCNKFLHNNSNQIIQHKPPSPFHVQQKPPKLKHNQSFCCNLNNINEINSFYWKNYATNKPINRCSSAKHHKRRTKSLYLSKNLPKKLVNDLFCVRKININKQNIRNKLFSAGTTIKHSQYTQTQYVHKKVNKGNKKGMFNHFQENSCVKKYNKISVYLLSFLSKKKKYDEINNSDKSCLLKNGSKSERILSLNKKCDY